MNEEEIKIVAENAMMIVCGYAFSQTEEGFIRVVYLHPPYHALVMTSEGEVTDTNMDDIEISIVQKYWKRNKKLMEQAYAKYYDFMICGYKLSKHNNAAE